MRSRRWQWQRQRQRLSVLLLLLLGCCWFSPVAGASPLYTVCRHTHAHTRARACVMFFLLLFHCFVFTTNTHAHTRMCTYNCCMRLCVRNGRVCSAALAASDQAQMKVGSAVAAAAAATGRQRHNRYVCACCRCRCCFASAKAQPNLQALSLARWREPFFSLALSLRLSRAARVSCAVRSGAASRCCLVAGQFCLGCHRLL